MDGITLAQAVTIVDGALAYGRELATRPLAVAVLDRRGCVKVLKQEDDASLMRPDIAVAKAWGVIGLGRTTRSMGSRAQESPGFYTALAALSGGRIVPVPGGVTVLDPDGRLLGAVGVSGDTSDRDEACAVHGVQLAGLRTGEQD